MISLRETLKGELLKGELLRAEVLERQPSANANTPGRASGLERI